MELPAAIDEGVAREIRAEIARQQRKQSELAEVLGVSQPGVSARLTGRQSLNVGEVVLIAQWLNVDPAKWMSTARAAAESSHAGSAA